MEESHHVCRRTIELEVELRLLKQQLAQAQQATQYLVNCICNQQLPSLGSTTNVEAHIRQVEDENAPLRVRLEERKGKDGRQLLEDRPCHLSFPSRSREASKSFPFETILAGRLGADGVCDDLLSFDDASPPSSATDGLLLESHSMVPSQLSSPPGSSNWTLSDPSTPVAFQPQLVTSKSKRGGLMLDSSNIPTLMHSTIAVRHSPDTDVENDAIELLIGEISSSEASPAELEQPSSDDCFPTDVGEWQATKPSLPRSPHLVFSKPFAHWEHSYLVGMATYIEDMSAGEQESYFKGREVKEPKRAAEEWKRYYENVVRPKFLAMREKKCPVEHDVSATRVEDQKCDTPVHQVSRKLADHAIEREPINSSLNSLRAPVESFERTQQWHALQPGITAICDAQKTLQGGGILGDSTAHQKTVPEPLETGGAPSQQTLHGLYPSADDLTSSSCTTEESLCEKLPNLGLEDVRPSPLVIEPTESSTTKNIEAYTCKAAPFSDQVSRRSKDWSRYSTPRGPLGNRFQQSPMEAGDLFFCYDSRTPSLYRTVVIWNIPKSTSLAEVLDEVRCGKIITAKYLQTAGFKTKPPILSNTVIVTFLHAHSASNFVGYCNQAQVRLQGYNSGPALGMKAQMIHTPSRRLSPQLIQDIRQNMTRVLFVVDEHDQWTPDQVTHELMHKQPGLAAPLTAGKDDSGILYFQFADIKDAAAAWKIIDQETLFFRGASKGFWPDPCERRWVVEPKKMNTVVDEDLEQVKSESSLGGARYSL